MAARERVERAEGEECGHGTGVEMSDGCGPLRHNILATGSVKGEEKCVLRDLRGSLLHSAVAAVEVNVGYGVSRFPRSVVQVEVEIYRHIDVVSTRRSVRNSCCYFAAHLRASSCRCGPIDASHLFDQGQIELVGLQLRLMYFVRYRAWSFCADTTSRGQLLQTSEYHD